MTRIVLLVALSMGLAACETGRGFVQDAENVGDALS